MAKVCNPPHNFAFSTCIAMEWKCSQKQEKIYPLFPFWQQKLFLSHPLWLISPCDKTPLGYVTFPPDCVYHSHKYHCRVSGALSWVCVEGSMCQSAPPCHHHFLSLHPATITPSHSLCLLSTCAMWEGTLVEQIHTCTHTGIYMHNILIAFQSNDPHVNVYVCPKIKAS